MIGTVMTVAAAASTAGAEVHWRDTATAERSHQ
jgi:hypothetical protein